MNVEYSPSLDLKSLIYNEVQHQLDKQVLSVCDNQDMIRHYNWIILLLTVILILFTGFIYFLWNNENADTRFWVKTIITIIYIIIVVFLIYYFVINRSMKIIR